MTLHYGKNSKDIEARLAAGHRFAVGVDETAAANMVAQYNAATPAQQNALVATLEKVMTSGHNPFGKNATFGTVALVLDTITEG
jgi:hypothetical protein